MKIRYILFLYALLNSLTYEIHLYKFFKKNMYIISFLFFLGIIVINLGFKKESGKSKRDSFLLHLLLLLLYLISSNYHYIVNSLSYLSYNEYIKVVIIIIWLSLAILVLTKKQIYLLFNYYFYIIFFLAFINIIIYFNSGFLLWNKVYKVRGASIFFDPNYWGVLNLFALTYFLFFKIYQERNIYIKIFIFFVLFVSLIISFSKASLLSLVFVISLYFLLKFRKVSKVFLLFFLFFIWGIVYFTIVNISNFRFQMGLNMRGKMWHYFLSAIQEKFFFGFGEKGIEYKLKSAGFVNSSFHSFFIDKTFAYGMLFGISLIFFSIYIFFKLYKENKGLSFVYLAMLICSNFIDYSFGGLGTNSFIFSLFYIFAVKGKYEDEDRSHS